MSTLTPRIEERLDPVLLAVLANRFESIVREMTNTLFRTGRSAVLNTARDFSCSIVTADNQLLQATLSHPRRAQRGEVVAVPLIRHPDTPPAHADDVVDIPITRLDTNAGKVQCPLLVEVLHERHVGRRLAVAAVGLMRLGTGGKDMDAIGEHRDEDGVIGAMGVAEIGIVVQERISLSHVRVQLAH